MVRWASLYPRLHSTTSSLLNVSRVRLLRSFEFSSSSNSRSDDPTPSPPPPLTVQVTQTTTLTTTTETVKKPRSRRRRTAFGENSIDKIPSFADFQQQQAVRNQYRQFLRLVKPLLVSSSDRNNNNNDVVLQIRREFRHTVATDSWQVKRALSEGTRRFKELSAMLGNQVQGNAESIEEYRTEDDPPNHEPSSPSAWPWQQGAATVTTTRSPPKKYPRKAKEIFKEASK